MACLALGDVAVVLSVSCLRSKYVIIPPEVFKRNDETFHERLALKLSFKSIGLKHDLLVFFLGGFSGFFSS